MPSKEKCKENFKFGHLHLENKYLVWEAQTKLNGICFKRYEINNKNDLKHASNVNFATQGRHGILFNSSQSQIQL